MLIRGASRIKNSGDLPLTIKRRCAQWKELTSPRRDSAVLNTASEREWLLQTAERCSREDAPKVENSSHYNLGASKEAREGKTLSCALLLRFYFGKNGGTHSKMPFCRIAFQWIGKWKGKRLLFSVCFPFLFLKGGYFKWNKPLFVKIIFIRRPMQGAKSSRREIWPFTCSATLMRAF